MQEVRSKKQVPIAQLVRASVLRSGKVAGSSPAGNTNETQGCPRGPRGRLKICTVFALVGSNPTPCTYLVSSVGRAQDF